MIKHLAREKRQLALIAARAKPRYTVLEPYLLRLNRSRRLEGMPGEYNGRPINSAYVRLPKRVIDARSDRN